jgi:4-aminobutyrate aminotransferase-like enzyme/Ser/Thr protein kinase RdoA (MazF antagonist)
MPDPAPLIALRASPPGFPLEMAVDLAARLFGVEGDATLLYGERDQNFRIRPASGDGVILKIVGSDEDPAVVDFQTAALDHVAATDPGLPVPRVIRTRTGEAHGVVADDRGRPHLVRAVAFQPGRILEGHSPGRPLLREIGGVVARLGRALRGFYHPAAGQKIAWDLRRAVDLRAYTDLIEPADLRRIVERGLDRFIATLPHLRTLRAQIIHNDAHPGNILVDEDLGAVVGILDFGDMIHGPLVFDLAVTAAERSGRALPPLDWALEVIAGYTRTSPLDAAEFDALYESMIARHAVSLTIHAWRQRHDPIGADKLTNLSESSVPALEELLSLGRDSAVAIFRAAAASPEADRSPEPDQTRLLARRRRLLGTGLELSYRNPVHLVRGEGVFLYDPRGRRYLDAYNNVPAVGHARREVAEAIARQMATLCSNTRYLHETVLDYAEALTATLPEGLGSCLFVNSGSEANDAAYRIAKAVTGHTGAIVIANAYHGVTDVVGALSPYYGAQAQPLEPWVRTLEPPDTYRGRYRGEDAAARYAEDADRAIASLQASGHGVAMLLIDFAFVSHGMLDVPAGYIAAIAAKVRAAGGLVVGDEVQSGFGRMGDEFWGFARHGIVPDLVTMGKPMANGHPVGAVVTRREILAGFTAKIEFFSTFGGNPVSAAAALATLKVLQGEGLQAKALSTGALFREGIRALGARCGRIGEVRGSGLMVGVDIVRDPETRTPAPDWARAISNGMRERGVLIGIDSPGANVLKIRPPLPFGPEHVEIALEAMAGALGDL